MELIDDYDNEARNAAESYGVGPETAGLELTCASPDVGFASGRTDRTGGEKTKTEIEAFRVVYEWREVRIEEGRYESMRFGNKDGGGGGGCKVVTKVTPEVGGVSAGHIW